MNFENPNAPPGPPRMISVPVPGPHGSPRHNPHQGGRGAPPAGVPFNPHNGTPGFNPYSGTPGFNPHNSTPGFNPGPGAEFRIGNGVGVDHVDREPNTAGMRGGPWRWGPGRRGAPFHRGHHHPHGFRGHGPHGQGGQGGPAQPPSEDLSSDTDERIATPGTSDTATVDGDKDKPEEPPVDLGVNDIAHFHYDLPDAAGPVPSPGCTRRGCTHGGGGGSDGNGRDPPCSGPAPWADAVPIPLPVMRGPDPGQGPTFNRGRGPPPGPINWDDVRQLPLLREPASDPHHGFPGPSQHAGLDLNAVMHVIANHPFAQRICDIVGVAANEALRHAATRGGAGGEGGSAAADGSTPARDDPFDDATASFVPPADLFRTASGWVVHVALPGAKKGDVGVNWDAETSKLDITGVVKRPGDEAFLSGYLWGERRVGLFRRQVHLPPVGVDGTTDQVDGEGITARLEDGILVVEVPRLAREKAEVRRVNIA